MSSEPEAPASPERPLGISGSLFPDLPTQALPTVAVGAIAVERGVLLLVRRLHPPEAGRWTLPGGRVQPGETLAAAVEREVAEETGLAVRCGGFVGWAERISAGYHYVILDFEVIVLEEGEEPCPGDDASEAAWVALEDLGAIDTVLGLEEFLRAHGVLG